MARGRGRGRGRGNGRRQQNGVGANPDEGAHAAPANNAADEDEVLREVLRQSQEDYERTQREEEEELQKAIRESLKMQNKTNNEAAATVGQEEEDEFDSMLEDNRNLSQRLTEDDGENERNGSAIDLTNESGDENGGDGGSNAIDLNADSSGEEEEERDGVMKSKASYALSSDEDNDDSNDADFEAGDEEENNEAGPSSSVPVADPKFDLSKAVYTTRNLVATRNFDSNDEWANHFRIAEGHFLRMLEGNMERTGGSANQPKISSIDFVTNSVLANRFERQKKKMADRQAPTHEVLAYHGTSTENLDSILKQNLQVRYATRQAYGRGIYFSEFPDVSIGYGSGLLLCRVLPGREYVDQTARNIPAEYDSKKVQPNQQDSGLMIIVENSDQILPTYIVHLKRPPPPPALAPARGRGSRRRGGQRSAAQAAAQQQPPPPPPPVVTSNDYAYDSQLQDQEARNGIANVVNTANDALNNDQVNSKMRTMFESSLQLHATGQHMQACQAVTTRLYPHQMYALAWMANRENKKGLGVHGGILADDMGLGKTLSIISLIMTNYFDGRPLARPRHGNNRVLSKAVQKYMPQAHKEYLTKAQQEELKNVGAKLKNGARKKDTKQPVKSSKKPFDSRPTTSKPLSNLDRELLSIDESLLSGDDSDDEFDSMLDDNKSLGKKLLGEDSATSELLRTRPEDFHFNDGLSDDEEYMNMTEKERNEKMMPNLNVDGNAEITSSEDDFEEDIASSDDDEDEDIFQKFSRKRKRQSKSVPSSPKSKQICLSSDGGSDEEAIDLPDLDGSILSSPSAKTPKKKNSTTKPTKTEAELRKEFCSVPDLTEEQKKNLIVPPRDPAARNGRRRATLIVTPASLISHWLEQIQMHVDKRVDLSIFVHHGQSKALIGKELEDQDIVITTYGTMGAELNSQTHSPLLRAKWLRVCLDEGHWIKNHRARAAKAAASLDTKRKWIISGTPIQNNLGELWSLLCWLDLEPYAGNRKRFKNDIETPVKHGDPRGVKRLQTVVEAVCLRRTKSDEVDGKPLVKLPKKTIKVRELEFNEEERAIYEAYLSQGRELILKFMRRGTLLKNYACVFGVMMRLRQLCCHRDLLPVDWSDVDIDSIIEFAAEQAAQAARAAAGADDDDGADDPEATKRLAEQLRDMIKSGMSDECSICLSEFSQPVITPCAHVYCRPCITQYIDTARPPPAQCPLCRGSIYTDKLLEAARDEEEEEEEADPFEDIVIKESSTKINAVLKELAGTKRDCPGEKTIVVSQFTSFLSILQPLLNDAGYNWTRLDGTMNSRQRAAVVSSFQSSDPSSPEILLLSLRAGGVGLNLTAASRLILTDPAWNPSTEFQCFDRIHRLGQLRDVVVTKLVMANSIETRMLDIQEKKTDLIAGAFRQSAMQRRNQRIQDIRDIFGI